jgi:hypothetical protein
MSRSQHTPLDLRVLTYTRPRTKAYFHYIAERSFASGGLSYTTDHRGYERDFLMRPFYELYRKRPSADKVFDVLSESTVEDIRLRCRYLRGVSIEQAHRMIFCMWRAAEDVLDRTVPEVILSLPIDCYVLDVLARVARLRGIAYAAPVPTCVNGYFSFGNRGRITGLRTPTTEEIQASLQLLLQGGYSPPYMKWTQGRAWTSFVKLYVKEKVKKGGFWLLRWGTRDPLNFNYNLSRYPEKMACDSLRHIAARNWFTKDWEQRLATTDGVKIMIPLQFYPEVSTDYWTQDTSLIPFYDLIRTIVESLAGSATVFVKEHPAAAGYRPPGFYRTMAAYEHVVLVPYYASTHELIRSTDLTITWGTTVGLESRIRGNPVITFGTPDYYVDGCFTCLDRAEQIAGLPAMVTNALHSDSDDCGEAILQKVLSGGFKGTLKLVDFEPTAEHVANASQVIESLVEYLPAYIEHTRQQVTTHEP